MNRKLDILKLSALCLTGLVLLLVVGLGGAYIYAHGFVLTAMPFVRTK